MSRFIRLTTLAIAVVCFASLRGQTELTESLLDNWIVRTADFIMVDQRTGTPTDSIIAPCFFVPNAQDVIAGLGCDRPLAIIDHDAPRALAAAQLAADEGYPSDLLYFAGSDNLRARRQRADTLPVALLREHTPLPVPLSAYALAAVLTGDRPSVLIDIRRPDEIASGMIPGACNLVWPDQFRQEIARWRGRGPIILYCASGNRAGQARTYCLELGFHPDSIFNFGGFVSWSLYLSAATTTPSPACHCTDQIVAIQAKHRKPGHTTEPRFTATSGSVSLYTLNGRLIGRYDNLDRSSAHAGIGRLCIAQLPDGTTRVWRGSPGR